MTATPLDADRRLHVAEALRDLLAVVNSHHDLDEILAEVLAQSSRLLDNDGGAIYLRDSANDDILRVRAARGLERDQIAVEVRVGSPTTGLAVQQGETLVCHDLREALADEITLVDQFRAVLATPLVSRGRAFGAITQYYARPRAFSPEQVDLARAFAEQAALAIENAQLHADAEHRTRENERRRRVAEGIRDLLATVNSTRSLDEILDQVLAQAADLLGSDAASVVLLDGKEGQQRVLTVRASRALLADIVPSRLPVGAGFTGIAVERGRPIAVSDLAQAIPDRNDLPPSIEERPGYLKVQRIAVSGLTNDADGLTRLRNIARHYRALLAVPLSMGGRVQGAITLLYRLPREFSREDVRLAETFADQTALAMENARLHAQTVRRSRDLEALYRADEALYRSLRLDQVLEALVDVAADVLEADMTSVLVWDEHHERLIPGATRGFQPAVVAQMSHAAGEGITGRVAQSGEPIAVEDAQNDPRVAHHITDVEGIGSLLHVPIKINGEVFGVFGVNYRQPRTLAGDEERLLLALAHRAAVAIENARLFEQAQQLATTQERQRLARELHDAVTQTLFSATLMAEVVPRVWERDPDQGRRRLEELRLLTRGALAEMRTLLLELRPTALVETPFVQLLRQLAETTTTRANLLVDVRVEGQERALPPEVQIALYRIAQEALNNTGKHAGASRAEISVRWRADGVDLKVSDDGRGFDPNSPAERHLRSSAAPIGLSIMRERARAIGARLRIQSRLEDGGTHVRVQWRG